MTHADVSQSVSLSHYFDVLRRRWWIVLLCASLGLGSALAYLFVVPERVTATAVVSLNVISTDPFNASRPNSALIDTAGEALVASSSAVSIAAAESLGGQYSPAEIRQSLDVKLVSDTAILRISSTRESATEAAEIADATADAFLANRSEQAQARIDRTVQATRDRIDPLREDLALANSTLATAEAGTLEAVQAETDRSLISSELSALFEQAATLEGIDTTGGSVVTAATGNSLDVEPKRSIILATGLLVGIGLGVLLAFVSNALAARIRNAQDIVQNGGQVLLGELDERRVTIPPADRDLDAFRVIRERMLADRRLSRRVGVCSVVDLSSSDHSGDVALNLAFVMASAGVRTEYVALNLSDEQVSELTLAMCLREEDDPSSGGRRFVTELNSTFSLYVAPVAETQVDEEPISRAVRHEMEGRRDDVLFVLRVPPSTAASTRLAAYRLSDVSVLVTGRGTTRMRQLATTAQDIRRVGTGILGAILVNHARSASVDQQGPASHVSR